MLLILSNKAKIINICITEQLFQGEEKQYEANYQSVTESFSIFTRNQINLPSNIIIQLMNMFKNIKTLIFEVKAQ